MGFPARGEGDAGEAGKASPCVPVSANDLQLKLLASENGRRRLLDQMFLLEDRLGEMGRRLGQYKAEAGMNAQGLRRCIEEKEAMAAGYTDLVNRRTKLVEECALYERDVGRLMEACDDLATENEELKVQSKETSSITTLVSEVESLRKDKEHLKFNLHRAEEEVKVLFKENSMLDEENKRLLKELNGELYNQGSRGKDSAGASSGKTRGKRKTTPTRSFSVDKVTDVRCVDLARQPPSPLQHKSQNAKLRKKQIIHKT